MISENEDQYLENRETSPKEKKHDLSLLHDQKKKNCLRLEAHFYLIFRLFL